MTKKVMKKIWGPIFIGKYTSPITVLLEPSNTHTTSSLGFMTIPLIVSLANELLGITLREELVSIKTLDKIVFTHSMEMWKDLYWFLHSAGSSVSLNPKLKLVAILLTMPSNWQTEIS